MSEVDYRKDVVGSIFRLSPSDLHNGSCRNVNIGYDRMCEIDNLEFKYVERLPSGGCKLIDKSKWLGEIVAVATICAILYHFQAATPKGIEIVVADNANKYDI
ncbi:hypothetical protein KC19_5G179200 [Ceratodon purpureus]|uniref:Uncharacterized protein n=1 Tax=Ceratodon purpureus TaxID=3225 RepID=A0A8T0I5C5_CERPU|nr:hypothetical protein KC19_5G179200 [Ceratodon purpureus]